jgi:hypothetical protein
MGELCDTSTPTIQAVELGKLALSGKLAEKVAANTGVSESWLMDNKVKAPILSREGKPLTKAYYGEFRSEHEKSGGTRPDYEQGIYELAFFTAAIADAVLEAHRVDKLRLLFYLLEKEFKYIRGQLSTESGHFESWLEYIHSFDPNMVSEKAKEMATSTLTKIFDDFWKVLDQQYQSKKDRSPASRKRC